MKSTSSELVIAFPSIVTLFPCWANPTSQTLTKQADVTRNKLSSLDGAAFDKAYVDNEVSYHKTVNTALSGTLIPDAQNPELKALLQSGLTLFEAHQKHAEQLAGQLH